MDDRFARLRHGSQAARRLNRDEISAIVGAEIAGVAALDYIDGVSTPDVPLPNRLIFIDHFSERVRSSLTVARAASMLVIATPDYRHLPHPHLLVDLPREIYARLVVALFDYLGAGSLQTERIHPSARIDPSARLSVGVTVGARSTIGAGTYIFPNVTIGADVRIGARCLIKSGTVIGQPGFGIYRDGEGEPQALPHVGGVAIGDEVMIGALNTVVAGTIHPTVVADRVKTDDHVHIAHNCVIGARTLITACAELSGSVTVGADSWLGPNCAIRDGVAIGERAFIGIGSNVIGPVADGVTVFGNPAKPRARS